MSRGPAAIFRSRYKFLSGQTPVDDSGAWSLAACAFLRENGQARFHTEGKFGHVDFSVAVHVETAQDCNQLLLGGQVPHRTQKPLKVTRVDIIIGPVIDRTERLLDTVVVGVFEGSFHQIGLDVQAHLFEDKLTDGSFHAHWK